MTPDKIDLIIQAVSKALSPEDGYAVYAAFAAFHELEMAHDSAPASAIASAYKARCGTRGAELALDRTIERWSDVRPH